MSFKLSATVRAVQIIANNTFHQLQISTAEPSRSYSAFDNEDTY